MKRLFEALVEIIKNYVNAFAEDTAEALEGRDKLHLLKNAFLFLLAILGIVACISAIFVGLYLCRRFLLPLIGVPVMAVVLVKSYLMNHEDRTAPASSQADQIELESRAEALYDYVRDGIFLVLRTVSEYTSIIRPASPSSIETNAQFCIREGVLIFQFNTLVSEQIKDLPELRRTLDRALGQMLRGGELPGLPSKLVSIRGRNYPPVQLLALTDLGSSVNIDVIFTNEESVALLERQRLLGVKVQKKMNVPYDEDF